jgi:hypothetical protein
VWCGHDFFPLHERCLKKPRPVWHSWPFGEPREAQSVASVQPREGPNPAGRPPLAQGFPCWRWIRGVPHFAPRSCYRAAGASTYPLAPPGRASADLALKFSISSVACQAGAVPTTYRSVITDVTVMTEAAQDFGSCKFCNYRKRHPREESQAREETPLGGRLRRPARVH